MNRRDAYRWGAIALSGAMAAILTVPGVAFLLDPLIKRRPSMPGGSAEGAGSGSPLARLSDLKVGEPRAFPVLQARTDAWVKYPPEPVGSVWLVRQPEGASEKVVAFTAECPHLGCAVNLAPDKKSFRCPCHNSGFDLKGEKTNEIPPRPMDSLKVTIGTGDDPEVRVVFERFVTSLKEKVQRG